MFRLPLRASPRAAFTLTELLVSIAVVGILATLLIPGLRQVSVVADGSRCASNLRQVGVALNSYAADNGTYLPYGYWVPPAGESWTWDKLIGDYIGLRKDDVWLPASSIMQCPADVLPELKDKGRYRRTYSMTRGSNGFGITANGIDSAYGGISINEVPAPNRTIIVSEFSSALAVGDGSDSVVGSPACSVLDSPQVQLTRGNGKPSGLHGGKMNYLFVDGHVELLAPSATIGKGTMSSPKGMWTLNPDD